MTRLTGVLIAAVLVFAATADAEAAEAVPTFTKDVAPILYKECVTCHRPGMTAPMSLISYEQVRPWARAIKAKVVSREMPPWFADSGTSGLRFKNERRLTEQDIDTLSAWADAGAPEGTEGDLPALPEFAEGWSHPTGREPDLVMQMPGEFEIPAEGELPNLNFYTKLPFNEDTFIEANEVRPGNLQVVHHINAMVRSLPNDAQLNALGQLLDDDGRRLSRAPAPGNAPRASSGRPIPGQPTSRLSTYTPGRGLELAGPGIGKRLPAGSYIMFNVHYQPTGKIERDRSRLGLWFPREPITNELVTDIGVGGVTIVEGKELIPESDDGPLGVAIQNIPPHAENFEVTRIFGSPKVSCCWPRQSRVSRLVFDGHHPRLVTVTAPPPTTVRTVDRCAPTWGPSDTRGRRSGTSSSRFRVGPSYRRMAAKVFASASDPGRCRDAGACAGRRRSRSSRRPVPRVFVSRTHVIRAACRDRRSILPQGTFAPRVVA